MKSSSILSRVALFTVYFWFGILKVFGQSPATPLVSHLFARTIAVMPFAPSFNSFIIFFGIFECAIGILFLIKGLERVALVVVLVHLMTTVLPLFLLPVEAWTNLLVPTLEGQYIIKNILIVALAVSLTSQRGEK